MSKKNKIIKICVPATGKNLESEIDSRFGRCKYFILAEIENGKISSFESVENTGAEQSSGAGIGAAEQISKLGTDILITEDVGPKAKGIVDQLGIKIIKDSGIVKEVLDRYINNN